MKRGLTKAWLVVGLAAPLSIALLWSAPSTTGLQASEYPMPSQLEPVETNVHDFMEYVFEPVYKQLKSSLADKPDKEGWKTIKSGALTLAEGANLVMIRPRESNPDGWIQAAVDVREAGSQFYQAAKAEDFQASQAGFKQLLNNCNQCHDKFAGGRPNLKL